MSATLDAGKFQQYFRDAPLLVSVSYLVGSMSAYSLGLMLSLTSLGLVTCGFSSDIIFLLVNQYFLYMEDGSCN